jgi:hypothetical protein
MVCGGGSCDGGEVSGGVGVVMLAFIRLGT